MPLMATLSMSLLPARAVRHSAGILSTGRASSMGSRVSSDETTAVGTAMRRPRRSTSIPPELPGLNSTSVRIHATSRSVFISKPETLPLVTLMVRTPMGKPKAHTAAPGFTPSGSVSSTVGNTVPSGRGVPSRRDTMRTMAMSRRTSPRTTRPKYSGSALSRAELTVAMRTCAPSP